MAARTLSNMRKAQSLLSECHSWLVKNNEFSLAVEFRRIEGELALLFEHKCFTTSPCPGLPRKQHLLSSAKDSRSLGTRGSTNKGYKPSTKKSVDQAPTRRTGSGQSSTPQGAKGSSGHSQSTSARPSIRRTLQAAPPVKQAPTGVLIEPHNGETIGLSPAMVAEMEIAKLSHLEPERSLSGLPAVTKDTPSSSVNDSTKAFYEDLSGLVDFGPPKEGVLIDFAEDVAVVRPAECVGTCSTHLPREGVSGVEGDDKIDNHSGLEDWANEDEVVFQGNRAMGIRANIGVLVGADDGLQTVPSAGDAQIEKNSEEIISQ